MLPPEQDYLDLLTGAENDAKASEPDEMESGEDGELYKELRRQEKQALVQKILKAKNQAQQQQAKSGSGAPNKGQPSPYLQRKVRTVDGGAAGNWRTRSMGGSSISPP